MLEIRNKIGIKEDTTLGMDCLELAMDKEHFLNYPKEITYRYNSRGFRDNEWPEDLSDVIWCIGDSFTTGLGQPFEETWQQLLQKHTGKRCLNLGEDGCSNDTMALRIQEIYKIHNPKFIIVMWSYLSRRRKQNKNIQYDKDSFGFKEDVTNFIKNYKIVNQLSTSVVNLIIPKAITYPDLFKKISEKELKQFPNLIQFEQIDWARDYHHFDVNTSKNVIKLIDNTSKYPI